MNKLPVVPLRISSGKNFNLYRFSSKSEVGTVTKKFWISNYIEHKTKIKETLTGGDLFAILNNSVYTNKVLALYSEKQTPER